jgi:hypothetical protein
MQIFLSIIKSIVSILWRFFVEFLINFCILDRLTSRFTRYFFFNLLVSFITAASIYSNCEKSYSVDVSDIEFLFLLFNTFLRRPAELAIVRF